MAINCDAFRQKLNRETGVRKMTAANDNSTEHPTAIYEQQLATAHRHASIVAHGMQKLLDPTDAAGVMIGAGAGVLEAAFGRERAIEYLKALADEMQAS